MFHTVVRIDKTNLIKNALGFIPSKGKWKVVRTKEASCFALRTPFRVGIAQVVSDPIVSCASYCTYNTGNVCGRCLLCDTWRETESNNRIESHLSEPLLMKYGVFQGSILDPLLFNIYTNYLCLVTTNVYLLNSTWTTQNSISPCFWKNWMIRLYETLSEAISALERRPNYRGVCIEKQLLPERNPY